MATVTVDIIGRSTIAATARSDVLTRQETLVAVQATQRERVESGGSGSNARFPIEFITALLPIKFRFPIENYVYSTLALLPERANYAVTDAGESISKDADGGLNRSRRDLSGSTSLVDVTWTLKGSDYDTLATFYLARTSERDGTFKIDLIIDQPELTTHLARFMPGTFVFNGQAGDTFTAQAQLEVTPLTPNAEYDASFVAIYGSQLANRYLFLATLATFANITLDTYF